MWSGEFNWMSGGGNEPCSLAVFEKDTRPFNDAYGEQALKQTPIKRRFLILKFLRMQKIWG